MLVFLLAGFKAQDQDPPILFEVRLDENQVQKLDLAWMCAAVVGVGQGWGVDLVLKGKTVRENVAFGLDGVSHEEVQEACKAMMLDEFVTGLYEGYETSHVKSEITKSAVQKTQS